VERSAKPASGCSETEQAIISLPFRLTHSEERIIAELLAMGELRDTGFKQRVTSKEFLAQHLVTSAAEFIEYLQHELFPQEMQLRRRRAELLQPLQGKALRAHFDQSLETPTLLLQARIHNEAEFADTLQRLMCFSFADWQRHCEQERADAD
jgi:hypothetical protein